MPRGGTTDTQGMLRDLRVILDGWEYEPGRISVRKIIGRGGAEKVQTRIDLGVLQMELDGRPDGQHPEDHESYFDLLQERLARHIELYGNDEEFILTGEDCHELRHETYLYYQRYLSLFVLEDFERVTRDTSRNLLATDFCEKYAASQEDRAALSCQRPYVLMMNARARACQALGAADFKTALQAVDTGVGGLRQLCANDERGEAACCGELRILGDLRQDILAKMPADAPARLEWELQAALAREDYENAARLRDALARQEPQTKAEQ